MLVIINVAPALKNRAGAGDKNCPGLESKAGVDSGDMSAEDVAAMFGNTKGFKQTEPNVVSSEDPVEDDF